jgi:hypothetical protein
MLNDAANQSRKAASEKVSKPTIASIQVLRFIAAMIVVIDHSEFVGGMFADRLRLPFYFPVFPGRFGVDIFFVISGFILHLVGRPEVDGVSFGVLRQPMETHCTNLSDSDCRVRRTLFFVWQLFEMVTVAVFDQRVFHSLFRPDNANAVPCFGTRMDAEFRDVLLRTVRSFTEFFETDRTAHTQCHLHRTNPDRIGAGPVFQSSASLNGNADQTGFHGSQILDASDYHRISCGSFVGLLARIHFNSRFSISHRGQWHHHRSLYRARKSDGYRTLWASLIRFGCVTGVVAICVLTRDPAPSTQVQRTVVFLGGCSYSLYLFHPHVLFFMSSIWKRVGAFLGMDLFVPIGVFLSIGTSVVVFSTLERRINRFLHSPFGTQQKSSINALLRTPLRLEAGANFPSIGRSKDGIEDDEISHEAV